MRLPNLLLLQVSDLVYTPRCRNMFCFSILYFFSIILQLTWSTFRFGLAGDKAVTGTGSLGGRSGSGEAHCARALGRPLIHGTTTVLCVPTEPPRVCSPMIPKEPRLLISIAKYGIGNLLRLNDPEPTVPPSILKALY